MRGKEITIMLVPHANEKARRITLPKRLIHVTIGLFTFIIVAFFFLVYRNITSVFNQSAYIKLVEENQELLKDFEKTKRDIEDLKQNYSRLAKFDNQIRIMTDLPIIDEETRMMGIGGPDLGINDPVEKVRNSYGLTDIRANLDGLIAQAKFQFDSFDKIVSKITENQDVWNHTPSIRPVDSNFYASGFGVRRHPLTGKIQAHKGLDFANSVGTPIYATADGKVIFSGRKIGFGNVIEIDHGYGYRTFYAHNSVNLVDVDDEVKRGDLIARVGNTGRSTGPHVHYEVRVNGTADNPLKYILNDDITSF